MNQHKRHSGSPEALVELHLHLEGALRPQRALELFATSQGLPSPPAGGVDAHGWHFEDLSGFLALFGWASRLLDRKEVYASILGDLVDELAAQGVVYAELFVAMGQMHKAGVDPAEVLPALAAVAQKAQAQGGPDIRFIADGTWQWGVGAAEKVLEDALELREHRIVGFGMGGDELAFGLKDFAPVYAEAQRAGLGLSAHAGEGTTPAAVAEVVEHLGVRRVGHGIAAIDDPGLMAELSAERVVLEVCPTSNRCTGAWTREQGEHPLLRFWRWGIPVILGSDDPAYFGSSLVGERELARQWGASEEELAAFNRTAAASAFLDPAAKRSLLRRLGSC